MRRDLASDANENLRDTFVTLAAKMDSGGYRQFGEIAAAATGVHSPLFNRVFVFEAPQSDDLSAAVDWIGEREVPFWLTVTGPVVAGVENQLPELDRDLVTAAEHPGMGMPSLDEIPRRESVADVVEVTGQKELDEFSRVAASVFEMPLDVEQRVDQAALAIDDVSLFLGRVDGDPAACGLLSQSGDVAGVYTIGVLDPFRRRGSER